LWRLICLLFGSTLLLWIFTLKWPADLNGQNAPLVSTREEQIEAERLLKAANLTPDEPSNGEKRFTKWLNRVPKFTEWGPVSLLGPIRLPYAIRPDQGGLPGGAGFSLGPRAEWKTKTDDVRYSLYGIGSIRTYYMVGTSVEIPRFAKRRMSFGIDGWYQYAPMMPYYGPGPDSSKGDRTDFLREFTSVSLRLNWRPSLRHVTAIFDAGPLFVNVGPGTSSHTASTEAVFTPEQAPGVDVQTNFMRVSALVDLNDVDVRWNPSQGTRVTAGYERYADLLRDQYSFSRLTGDVSHYIPFLNKKRVIALHAGTALSYHADDQVVPFYLQPTLGGPNDDRGFRRYRFYDNNVIRLNAEYRWTVCLGFETAIFGDAGKVFNNPGQISLSNLESSVGFGLRFVSRDRLLLRLDTAFSHEGFQVWLQAKNPF